MPETPLQKAATKQSPAIPENKPKATEPVDITTDTADKLNTAILVEVEAWRQNWMAKAKIQISQITAATKLSMVELKEFCKNTNEE